MKILVVGSGGREHAIVWKIKEDMPGAQIFCAPGNAGISLTAHCVNIEATDIDGLLDFALKEKIDLTIVGMDDPLVLGIVDVFKNAGLPIFGPEKKAAVIEGSKAFSKELMEKYGIPTAQYRIFTDAESALAYIADGPMPVVVKADGLALGKGVLICQNKEEAAQAIQEMMVDNKFGQAGKKIVIEEFMAGKEVSVLAFCDGKTIIPMPAAQDHKKAFTGDKGLNTGGMGAFCPSPFYTDEIAAQCMERIFKPTVEALRREGRPFVGCLFFGLMLTNSGPKVVEYNARFGDPETQAVLPLLETSLLEIIQSCIKGTLTEQNVRWKNAASVCVVLASGGYPLAYEKGYEIEGLNKQYENSIIFHAGTKKENDKIITNGGRVLGITGTGATLKSAGEAAYSTIQSIHFKDAYYRSDIGPKPF